jgi:hypothetical protein
MGLMDKAKEAALQAKASAQQMAQQGQAKVASVQQGRSEAELLRALGEAFYNEQRRGGDQQAVIAALGALDAHYAGTPQPTGPEPAPYAGDPPATMPPPTTMPAGPGPQPGAAPQGGSFTLNDL